MGTDIHLFVEVFKDGKWKSADVWKDEKYGWYVQDPFYSERCYDLFAILADVRNGYGFASISTGEGFVPISPPRGVASSLSPEVQREFDAGIEHTPSWLLLQDIFDYDWEQTTVKVGWIALRDWLNLIAQRNSIYTKFPCPRSWSGGVSGPDIKHLESKDALETLTKLGFENLTYAGLKDAERALRSYYKVDSPKDAHFDSLYIYDQWPRPYYLCCSQFWSETIPRLINLARREDVTYSDIRLVFYFDS